MSKPCGEKIMNKKLFIVCAMLTLSTSVFAATPEEIASAYFDAFRRGDMAAVSAAMHPEETSKFQAMIVPVLEKGLAAEDDRAELLGLDVLIGGDSIEYLYTEAPDVFFTRFMKWLLELNPTMKSSMAGATVQPLGHVDEGELVHVVYRMQMDMLGARISQISAISLKKDGDTWKLMLTGEIEGMGKLLEANLDMMNP